MRVHNLLVAKKDFKRQGKAIMTSKEIEINITQIFENFSKEDFLFNLLMAYGISKTNITRLRKGDYNLSNVGGEILYKKKIFFKQESEGKLLSSIEFLSKEERILRHNPRFVVLTDYKTLVAKDLKLGKNLDIAIQELPKHFDFFLPLAGSEVYNTKNNNKADREAAYKMAELYDNLIHANPDIYNSQESIHDLNIFLSRILFCFFAEDTEIFEEDSVFTNTLVQHTIENGSDTHIFLNDLFRKLNTKISISFPAYLAKFPYVNGGLFRDEINLPKFNTKARKTLIELGELDWKEINPDIFGSMIQAVVLSEYRSDFGMHYTSVENILKLIKPLFLDELYEEFEKCKNEIQLRKLIFRMSKMKFFDPACGSGNFLIITYKEIRILEIKILQRIIELNSNPRIEFTQIQLSQFYGIEINDFAHEIAILSLWLAEHQMNKIFEERLYDYGKSKPILPLKEAGKIVQGNATRLNWKEVCPIAKNDEVNVIGNPPYLGSRKQKKEQKEDLKFVFSTFHKYKDLDYISIWLYKSALYIKGNNSKSAFVSTNSICQGEQVSLLWPHIFSLGIDIAFAYTSFKWTNNAKSNAGVTVIILGLANHDNYPSFLFEGQIKRDVENINAYLIPSKNNIFIQQKNQSISNLPKINHGNMPADGGEFLFDAHEKKEFLDKEPEAEKWFKKLVSVKEHFNGRDRWCLWLEDISTAELDTLPEVKKIVEKVKIIREKSSRPQLANVPHLFAQITQPKNTNCIIIPRVSSENRDYLPIDLLDGTTYKVTDSFFTVATNEPYVFGIVSSKMHKIWTEAIGGKLETRIQYSKTLCYNTFPFPNINIKDKENLNLYVYAILDERAKYPEKTMAQLYDPRTMPVGLKQAHKELDEAVERCYRLQPFKTDTERLEYLFKLYEEMIQRDTLFAKQKKTKKKK